MVLKRVALAAIASGVALLLTTAASGSHHAATLRLELVPLQKAQLGAAGASLALNSGPGRITNSYLGFNFFGDYYQPYGSFAKLGRITGYGLSTGAHSSAAPE